MKIIYTSNYARQANNPRAFGISAVTPDWFNGYTLPKLAPTMGMVSKIKDGGNNYNAEDYTKDYIELLEERGIDAEELVNSLPNEAMLLCYESPGDFCHRHVLTKWIQEQTGVIIPEWKNIVETKADIKDIQNEEKKKLVDTFLKF